MLRRAVAPLAFAALIAIPLAARGATPPAATGTKSAGSASAGSGAKPRSATGATRARTFEPRVYMSWNAPYGSKRATTAVQAACGDTAGADTLYLTVDPGRTAPDFRGVSAVIYFHAAEGATLSDFWKSGGGGLDGSPVRVVFDSDPDRGFETFATAKGVGAPKYDFSSGSGRIRMIYAFPGGPEKTLEGGKRYGFARLIVKRPAEGASGCGEAICIEWFSAKFAYSVDEEKNVNTGERWVTLNSPDGSVCEASRAVIGATPWKPKQP